MKPATLLLLNAPDFLEFGIDNQYWKVGSKFKGIKSVPPGAHYIYYSLCDENYQQREGNFIFLKPGQVYVRKWSQKRQAFIRLLKEEEEAYTLGVNSHEFDSYLGPYPIHQHTQWLSCTNHMDEITIDKINPIETYEINEKNEYDLKKRISVKEFSDEIEEAKEASKTTPNAKPTETVAGKRHYFIDVPRHVIKHNAKPTELTTMNIDKSQTLKEQMGAFSFSSILGELQYAFIGFIIGTDAECMEHWAQLLDLLCTCNAYSQDNPLEYCKFIETLRKQLSQFPRDFFFDNITKDNFMRESLYSLYALVTQSINEEIKKEGSLLFKILNSEFKFDASDSEGLSD